MAATPAPITPETFASLDTGNAVSTFEVARAEGWYAIGTRAIDTTSVVRCRANMNEALTRAKDLENETYTEGEENPFIEPSSAIYALRLALRALVVPYADRAAAILAIGNALVTIENPE